MQNQNEQERDREERKEDWRKEDREQEKEEREKNQQKFKNVNKGRYWEKQWFQLKKFFFISG